MASSSFSDAPNPETSEAEAKSVTIVINDNGEINYDEKTLQSIIGKSSTMSFSKFKALRKKNQDFSTFVLCCQLGFLFDDIDKLDRFLLDALTKPDFQLCD